MADQRGKSDSIFWAALEIDAPAERAAYLDSACASDSDLRAQLEEMLEAYCEGTWESYSS